MGSNIIYDFLLKLIIHRNQTCVRAYLPLPVCVSLIAAGSTVGIFFCSRWNGKSPRQRFYLNMIQKCLERQTPVGLQLTATPEEFLQKSSRRVCCRRLISTLGPLVCFCPTGRTDFSRRAAAQPHAVRHRWLV